MNRSSWTDLSDSQLLAQCHVDTYRASGPGGQKRNKTSSAVRIRHPPSGLMAIAEESRSQHENRARALRRLRQALYLQLRQQPAIEEDGDERRLKGDCMLLLNQGGRLVLGKKDPRYWPAVGIALDVLEACHSRVSEAAQLLGISTANLVDFLAGDPKVWQEVNQMRGRAGQKPLIRPA